MHDFSDRRTKNAEHFCHCEGVFTPWRKLGPAAAHLCDGWGDEAKNVKTTRGNPVNKKAVGCADTLIKLDPFDCAKLRMRDIAVLLRLG